MSQAPRPHIFVATHHKSGSSWLVATFQRIAESNGFPFIHLNTAESGWDIRPDKLDYLEEQRAIAESQSDLPAVIVDFHSAIPDLTATKSTRGARGLHVIRDPRDMLLSAVRYHLVSDEPWLHQPTKAFAGQTYQQRLSDYTTLEDRIRFEIDHSMGRVIREMHAFDRQSVFRDVRYEELIVDTDLLLFHSLCVYLGIQGQEIIPSLQAYWLSSIFGGMKSAAESGTHPHIRDARPHQWRSQLSPASLGLIQSNFEQEILGLGYPLADESDLISPLASTQ